MTGIIWITESDTILIHERLLALNGGAAGIRDRGLLQSALARPQQLHHYAANPTAAAGTILAVASGDLDEEGLGAFLKANSQRPKP